MTEQAHSEPAAAEAAAWAGPRWLWFGALGGAIAWLVHLWAAWGSVELACSRGSGTFVGIDLGVLVPLTVIVPGVVALGSWLVAARASRVLRRARDEPPADVEPRRIGRALFMARVGCWVDAFSLMMIIFGGAAVIIFAPCER